jgi:hypothetical protein
MTVVRKNKTMTTFPENVDNDYNCKSMTMTIIPENDDYEQRLVELRMVPNQNQNHHPILPIFLQHAEGN